MLAGGHDKVGPNLCPLGHFSCLLCLYQLAGWFVAVIHCVLFGLTSSADFSLFKRMVIKVVIVKIYNISV